MKRTVVGWLAAIGLATPLGAQSFEVASVKTSAAGSRYKAAGGPGTSDPGQIVYTATSLKSLLAKAFGVQGYQVSGPEWLAQARYDIAGKLPPGASKEDLAAMLRNLLTERFRLAGHRETKELPVYAMVVGKKGSKLTVTGTAPEVRPTDQAEVNTVSLAKDGLPVMPPGYPGHLIGMTLPGKTMLRARGETLADFAKVLTDLLDRPVLDCTGMSGKYDFGIAWSTDQAAARAGSFGEGLEPGPDVFTAFQSQLGLRLEPRKAPVEMVVVDRIERSPTAN